MFTLKLVATQLDRSISGPQNAQIKDDRETCNDQKLFAFHSRLSIRTGRRSSFCGTA